MILTVTHKSRNKLRGKMLEKFSSMKNSWTRFILYLIILLCQLTGKKFSFSISCFCFHHKSLISIIIQFTSDLNIIGVDVWWHDDFNLFSSSYLHERKKSEGGEMHLKAKWMDMLWRSFQRSFFFILSFFTWRLWNTLRRRLSWSYSGSLFY